MEKKTYFISADIEGITDVTSWSETNYGEEGYEEARIQMSKEVAAACEAIIEAGHDVVVRDGHNSAKNILHDMLPYPAKLMRGWACHPGSMMAGIDGKYAGALYIGYHSPAGSDESPLAHTISYSALRRLEINGKLASEFTLNSFYAAEKGVPSIFISGDAGICRRAKEEIPDIFTLSVKECKGNSTFNLHPKRSCELIKEGVARAIESPAKLRELPEVYELRVRLEKHQAARAALSNPKVKRLDEHTLSYTAHSPSEVNVIIGYMLG